MRLIDADELKKKLWSPTETWVTENIVTEEEIDETSTAYDIDKIVEQLEENYSCDVGNLKMISLDKTIEIVKGGAE